MLEGLMTKFKSDFYYDQGYLSAKGDFGWCSLQVRRGIKEYFCADCNYTKMGDTYIPHTEAWRKGYVDYFAKQNQKPRKNQVSLPIFE